MSSLAIFSSLNAITPMFCVDGKFLKVSSTICGIFRAFRVCRSSNISITLSYRVSNFGGEDFPIPLKSEYYFSFENLEREFSAELRFKKKSLA